MRAIKKHCPRRCIVTGTIDRLAPSPRDNNSTGLCLRDCIVEGIDHDFTVPEDHLWVWFDSAMLADNMTARGYAIGSTVSYVGAIARYRRADGSEDYGIFHLPGLTRYSFFLQEVFPSLRDQRKWAEILNALESGNIYNDFRQLPHKDFLTQIEERKRDAIANLKRCVPHPPPPSVPGIQFPQTKATSKNGFGR